MNDEYCIGRINFGPRDSFTTLGQLIDEIGAQEELVEDLCLFAGDLLTEREAWKQCAILLATLVEQSGGMLPEAQYEAAYQSFDLLLNGGAYEL